MPPSPVYFHDWKRRNLHSLPSLQSPCKYTKEISFLMNVFRTVPSPQSNVSVRRLPGTSSCCFFLQTSRWFWRQVLGSHILAFRNSVNLPSRRHKSKYVELWYLPDRCDTLLLLHHEEDCRHLRPSYRSCSPIFENCENLIWSVIYFLFGRTLNKNLANGSRNLSKLLINLTGAGLRTSFLKYFS